MADFSLLSPPIAFLILIVTGLLLYVALRKLTFKPKSTPDGQTKPYSCGEDMPSHMIQPDYSQFFPFAFYFTILHVVALMAATVPAAKFEATFTIAVVYIVGAIIGLFVLYRR